MECIANYTSSFLNHRINHLNYQRFNVYEIELDKLGKFEQIGLEIHP